jgi:hypothetical protein
MTHTPETLDQVVDAWYLTTQLKTFIDHYSTATERILKAAYVHGYAQRDREVTACSGTLPDLEEVAAQVHQAWLAQKHQAGITSHRLQQTGEELCVPYEVLSEVAKELDRATVRAVFAAIAAAQSGQKGEPR